MALAKATIKATIVGSMTSIIGAPADPVVQEKFAEALADAIFTILTTQAQVQLVANGIDNSGYTLVTNLGLIT